MFNKLVDVLKEVFWIKPKKKKQPVRRIRKGKLSLGKTAVKKTVKKKIVKKAAPKALKPSLKKSVNPPSSPAKPLKLKKPLINPTLVQVGIITHYFDRIKVCVVKINQGTILIGDRLTIATKNSTSSFVQKIWSMQVESQDVKVAKKGQLIGIKIDKPVAVGDIVYK